MKYEYGTDQNVGLSEYEIQEDFVRVGRLTTAANLELLVAVVADSDSLFRRGDKPARLAVSALRRTLQKSEETVLGALIQEAMGAAHQALQDANEGPGQRDPERVSLTLALIHNDRLYLAHNGTTGAYLQRGSTLFDLIDGHENSHVPLGQSSRASYQLGLRQTTSLDLEADGSLQMIKGDRLVLCSDGLTQPRPGKSEPLLDAAVEMPPILLNRAMPSLEAARTLVSLAVGRKAQDNVSVAVISAPPPRDKRPLLILAAFLLILIVVASIAGLVATDVLGPKPTPTATPRPTLTPTPTATPLPPDDGRACININNVGIVRTVDNFSLGATGCAFVGSGVIVENGQGALLTLSDESLVGLEAGSRLLFRRMDREDDPSLTILVLESGRILVHQTEEGDIIEILDEDGNLLARLNKMGTLAVSWSENETVVSCFGGACQYGEGNELTVGNEAVFSLPDGTASTNPINEERQTFWQELCECLPEGE